MFPIHNLVHLYRSGHGIFSWIAHRNEEERDGRGGEALCFALNGVFKDISDPLLANVVVEGDLFRRLCDNRSDGVFQRERVFLLPLD